MSNLSKPSSSSRGFPFQSTFNNGNLYNSNKGIFTCSENGLYAFAFVIEVGNSKSWEYFNVYLYRSGNKLSNIKVNGFPSPGELDATSTLQIFNLTQGDTIYVYSPVLNKDIEPFHSTFSGWQIATSYTPAFLAYTSIGTTSKPLNYSTELLDTSNSFSNTYFQAPKDGVYLFFWKMLVYGRRLESFLLVNNETVGRAIIHERAAADESSSNLAIVRILKNDCVKVMHDGAADGSATMISGYFLF